jgi:short subunit dehydrogenase-like uncharacterized protein
VAVDAFQRRHGTMPESVKSVAGKSRGGVSGGTMASVFNILRSSSWAELRQLGDPYILCPEGRQGGPDRGQQMRPRWEAVRLVAWF